MNKQWFCKFFVHELKISRLGCQALRRKVLQYNYKKKRDFFFPMHQGNAIKSKSSMIRVHQARNVNMERKEYLHRMHFILNSFSFLKNIYIYFNLQSVIVL